jgi:hypothetical protein
MTKTTRERRPRRNDDRRTCYGCGDPAATKDPVFGWWCARCSGKNVPVLPGLPGRS